MILPLVPTGYVASAEAERNRILEQADRDNFKRRRDVELVSERLILRSANGSRWEVTVSDAGTLSASLLPTLSLGGLSMTLAQGTLTVSIT